jgi:hypothetical protein
MKVLITENRLHSSIEKYILDGYPMVSIFYNGLAFQTPGERIIYNKH